MVNTMGKIVPRLNMLMMPFVSSLKANMSLLHRNVDTPMVFRFICCCCYVCTYVVCGLVARHVSEFRKSVAGKVCGVGWSRALACLACKQDASDV